MARKNILGVITGKLGNMVGQSNSLINGKDKQVWRQYQGEVTNPKSTEQQVQRALFIAAKNFQSGLEEILNHSWQGFDYGTKSLNHFRSLVLANKGANYPGYFFQGRGEQRLIPQPWPVSTGSVPADFGTMVFDEGYPGIILTDIHGGTAGDDDLSKQFKDLMAAYGVSDGAQVTLVGIAYRGQENPLGLNVQQVLSATFVPVVGRFIYDSTANVDTMHFEGSNYYLTTQIYGSGSFAHLIINEGVDQFKLVAAALIVSTKVEGKAQWKRNKATMQVAPIIKTAFGSVEYINAALATLSNEAGEATSNWYLNLANSGVSIAGDPGYIANKTYTSENVPTEGSAATASVATTTRVFDSYPVGTVFTTGNNKFLQYTAPNKLAVMTLPEDEINFDFTNIVIIDSSVIAALQNAGYEITL